MIDDDDDDDSDLMMMMMMIHNQIFIILSAAISNHFNCQWSTVNGHHCPRSAGVWFWRQAPLDCFQDQVLSNCRL